MSSSTQLTGRCPKCGSLGIRFVNSDGTQPNLKDFEAVVRHQPVQMAPAVRALCINKSCDQEYK